MQIVESAYFDTKILSYINYDLFGKLFNGTEDNVDNNSSIITNNFYYTYTNNFSIKALPFLIEAFTIQSC